MRSLKCGFVDENVYKILINWRKSPTPLFHCKNSLLYCRLLLIGVLLPALVSDLTNMFSSDAHYMTGVFAAVCVLWRRPAGGGGLVEFHSVSSGPICCWLKGVGLRKSYHKKHGLSPSGCSWYKPLIHGMKVAFWYRSLRTCGHLCEGCTLFISNGSKSQCNYCGALICVFTLKKPHL